MRYLLLAVASVSGIPLAARAVLGPFAAIHSPMNAEGILALALMAMILWRNVPSGQVAMPVRASQAVLVSLAVAGGFALYLNFPLLADDYSHIWNAQHADGHALLAHFTVPEEDRFFRPAGYLSYALDALWAGYHPAAWRISSLVLHLANCALVLWLCRVLGFSEWPAAAAALLFGLHGSRPEAVTWVAARFDLLAVLFGLASILVFLRGFRMWVVLGLLLGALLSKESAYIVPFVLAAILVYRRQPWREIAVRIWPLLALEAITFGYRTWLLKGIGGYQDAVTGQPAIFHFGPASSLKALFLRFWAVLFFPMNWTGGLNGVLGISFAAVIAMLIFAAWRGADRRKVLLGVAIASLCSLPVQQFLSIGPDLEKSRVLYMGSIGLAIVMAALFERSVWLGPGIIAFQLIALESNLQIWKRTGYAAERACLAGASALRSDPRPLAAMDLPNVLDGVYFLHTGYPECVRFQMPEAAGRVFIHPRAGAQQMFWNETRKILERR